MTTLTTDQEPPAGTAATGCWVTRASSTEVFIVGSLESCRARSTRRPDIVDDACAYAWTQFLHYQPDRNRGWRSWLITTAEREAWRLHRKEAAHSDLEFADAVDLVAEPVDQK
jgi:DNA-directed RNA polymerase specialized sigma24 family protein